VSDARGVVWEMDERHPSALNAIGDDADSGPALDALIDALLIPEVFDRVLEKTAEMPYGVASPGLRAVIGRLDDGLLTDFQLRCARRIVEGSGDGDEDEAEPPDELLTEPLLLLLGHPRAARPRVLHPPEARSGGRASEAGRDGPNLNLYSRIAACEQMARQALAAAEATESPRRLARRKVSATAARERTSAVGRSLHALRDAVGKEFVEIDGRRGLSSTDRNRLGKLGVSAADFGGPETGAVTASLRELVETGLRRGHTLVEVDRWVVWMQRKLLPAGSASRRDKLHDTLSDPYLAKLENADPLHVRLVSPKLLGPMLVCCVLAGLLPASLSLGLGVVGALVAGVAATLVGGRVVAARDSQRLRPDPAWRRGGGPRQLVRDEAGNSDLWAFGGLAFVAGLGGAVVGGAVLAPALGLTLPAAVAAGLSVVVVGGAVAVLVRVLWNGWSLAAARWLDAVSVRSVTRRVQETREIVEEVARDDWLLANPRRAASNLASALHDVMTGLIATIVEYADDLAEAPPYARPPAAPGISMEVSDELRRHGKELNELFRHDLVDVAMAVLARGFDELAQDDLESMADWVPGYTAHMLRAYNQHLDRMGVHGIPPFGTPSQIRRTLVETVWKASHDVATLLRTQMNDPAILQLAAGNDLSFFDPRPAHASMVPFLPRASRPAHGRTGAGQTSATPTPEGLGEAVWTEWGQVAGLLRLVPLTPGSTQDE
jgi:hypothetical protein